VCMCTCMCTRVCMYVRGVRYEMDGIEISKFVEDWMYRPWNEHDGVYGWDDIAVWLDKIIPFSFFSLLSLPLGIVSDLSRSDLQLLCQPLRNHPAKEKENERLGLPFKILCVNRAWDRQIKQGTVH